MQSCHAFSRSRAARQNKHKANTRHVHVPPPPRWLLLRLSLGIIVPFTVCIEAHKGAASTVHMCARFSHIRPAFLPLLEDFIFTNAQENIQGKRNLEDSKTLLGRFQGKRQRGKEG